MNLRPLDLGCFVTYMVLLVGTGLFFTRRQKSLKSYLLADQDIHWIIVAISVLAALFSGITYLGAPAEAYYHDLCYIWVLASFFIATPITTLVFLPFFRGLNLFTAYEYLDRRFDLRVRRIASALFIARVTLYMAMVIYAPALAIMEITGWPLWISVSLTGGAATLYTTFGGMKAVIWTDSLQFLVLCGGILLILGFAIAEVPGGFATAWDLAARAGRTRFLNFSIDPTVRITFWGAVIGGTCHNLVQMVTDQISVQRYLTAKSLEECQRALWLKLGVTLPLVIFFYLTGTVLFGYYQVHPDREPVVNAAGQVVARAEADGQDQARPLSGGQQNRILPFFVVRQLPSPLPGILIAAVFGATIATVSAGINALATAALIDFGSAPGNRTTQRGRPVPAGSRPHRPLRDRGHHAGAGDRPARHARRGVGQDVRRLRRAAPGHFLPGRALPASQWQRRPDRGRRGGDHGSCRRVFRQAQPDQPFHDVDPRGIHGSHFSDRMARQPGLRAAGAGGPSPGLPRPAADRFPNGVADRGEQSVREERS